MMVLEMADLDFDLVMKSKYVVVDAYWVQGQKLLYRAEHVKHDGSEVSNAKLTKENVCHSSSSSLLPQVKRTF